MPYGPNERPTLLEAERACPKFPVGERHIVPQCCPYLFSLHPTQYHRLLRLLCVCPFVHQSTLFLFTQWLQRCLSNRLLPLSSLFGVIIVVCFRWTKTSSRSILTPTNILFGHFAGFFDTFEQGIVATACDWALTIFLAGSTNRFHFEIVLCIM